MRLLYLVLLSRLLVSQQGNPLAAHGEYQDNAGAELESNLRQPLRSQLAEMLKGAILLVVGVAFIVGTRSFFAIVR